MGIKYTKEQVYKIIEDNNFKVFKDFKYKNNETPIICKDIDGYIVIAKIIKLQQNRYPLRFSQSNPYTIQNIKLWLNLNNKKLELISDKYVSAKDKLNWKCLSDKCGESFNETWNNIKNGNGCPYCSGHKVSKNNCLAFNKSNLLSEWDFIKNELTPYDITCNSHEKVWWKCKKCGYEWKATISSRYNGAQCPKCTHKIKKDTNYFKNEVNNLVGKEFTVNGEYISSQTKILITHNICNNSFMIVPNNFLKRHTCPICSNKIVVQGYNDMLTTNPKLAMLTLNENDRIKYTENSGEKIDWRCPECGEIIKNKQIKNINYEGLSCPKCSDGISFPEKFMYSVLQQLNIDFEYQKTINFNSKFKYDFYIPSINCIIETHGLQHYKEFKRGRSLQEEQNNDKNKEIFAKENKISNYIVIDCSCSELEYIKNSIINSNLPKLLNFIENDINWNKCCQDSLKSLVKVACDLFNKKLNVIEISKILKLSDSTIRHYLHKGNKIQLCKYNGRNTKS